MFHPSDHDPRYPRISHHRYNPNQPRVPRGHPDGGQWTSGGYRPLSELAELPAPDRRGGEEERALYTRYALMEERDPRIKAPGGTPGLPRVRLPKFLLPGALGLLGLLPEPEVELLEDDSSTYPALLFRARRYSRAGPGYAFQSPTRLTEEEAAKYCPELPTVQKMLDKAADEAGPPNKYDPNDPGAFGKAVHEKMVKAVDAYNKDRKNRNRPKLGKPEITIAEDGTLNVEFNEEGAVTPDLSRIFRRKNRMHYGI